MYWHARTHTHTNRNGVCFANLEGDHNDSKCIEAALCLVLLGFGHLHQNGSPVLIVYPRLITLCLSLLTAGEALGHGNKRTHKLIPLCVFTDTSSCTNANHLDICTYRWKIRRDLF